MAYWCPACGCSVSGFVKAEAKKLIARLIASPVTRLSRDDRATKRALIARRNAEILARYACDENYSAIGRRVGLSGSQVSRVIRQALLLGTPTVGE